MIRPSTIRAMLTAAALGFVATVAIAGTLPMPQGRSILQIEGNVTNVNAENRASFDLAMLENLGVHRVHTSTPWTEGKPVFEGVLLRDLLKHVGGEGTTVTAIALNDYKVKISASDFANYPVILAYRMNGELLKVREKGPLWIIYPQDQFPELNNKPTHSKWAWQVKALVID